MEEVKHLPQREPSPYTDAKWLTEARRKTNNLTTLTAMKKEYNFTCAKCGKELHSVKEYREHFPRKAGQRHNTPAICEISGYASAKDFEESNGEPSHDLDISDVKELI